MKEIHEEIKEAVRQLETYKNSYTTIDTQEVIDMLKRLNENVKLTIPVVVQQSEQSCNNTYCQDGTVEVIYGEPLRCSNCDK